MTRLHHANVVQVFELVESEGRFGLVMELVRGRDLGRVLERCRELGIRLGLVRAVQVGVEVAKALAYAHRLTVDGQPVGLVHRDVSPHNILVSYEGEVKLADFGIARAASRLDLTDPGTVKGKLAYMAPEQARGEPLDGRADVFALGVVLWELCAGPAALRARVRGGHAGGGARRRAGGAALGVERGGAAGPGRGDPGGAGARPGTADRLGRGAAGGAGGPVAGAGARPGGAGPARADAAALARRRSPHHGRRADRAAADVLAGRAARPARGARGGHRAGARRSAPAAGGRRAAGGRGAGGGVGLAPAGGAPGQGRARPRRRRPRRASRRAPATASGRSAGSTRRRPSRAKGWCASTSSPGPW